jgi:Domain of unknown function (DUF1707)
MPDEERGDQVQPAVELRASHEDRDRVAEILRVAAGDGRLTAEELDQRLEVALTARTQRELTALTVDLPATAGSALTGVPAPTAKDLVRIDTHSGTARRDGRWVVPQAMDVKVTSGHVVLDFTNAVITAPVLKVHAEVKSGTVRMLTKPGIVVETDDVAIRSGSTKIREPWGHDVPVTLRVEVSGSVGSGSLTAGPRRRSFWAWLLRRPPSYLSAAR